MFIFRYNLFCLEFTQPVRFGASPPSHWNNLSKNITKTSSSNSNSTTASKDRPKVMLTDLYNKCTFLAIDKGRHLTTDIKFLSKDKLHGLDMRFISSELSLTNKHRFKLSEDSLENKKTLGSSGNDCKKVSSTFASRFNLFLN